MSARPHRREHQRRADRLEARFDPLNPNDPNAGSESSTVPASPNKPNKPTPTLPGVPSAVSTNVPVLPTTTNTLLQVPPTSVAVVSTAVVVVPPLGSNASSNGVLTSSLTPSSISISSLVQTAPTFVAIQPTTVVQHTPTINSVPVAAFSTLSSASYSSSTPSATGAPSSGMGAGTIAGVAAGSLAGIALLGAAGMWAIKRFAQSKEDESDATPFTRHSWMRNSVALPDGPAPSSAPSTNPRPPTMIERKQANMAGRGFPQGGFQGYGQGGYGYGQGQPAYGPASGGYMPSLYQDSPYGRPPMGHVAGQQVMPQQQQPPSPIASPPLHPPSPSIIDETAPPVSYNNTAPVYFTRHDSMQSDVQSQQERTLPNPYETSQGAGYATLDRASVTPYQAKQYAEISRQLDVGGLPSPFEDPVLSATNSRVDSNPPVLPAMRAMSPVNGTIHSNDATRAMSPPVARGFAVPSPISVPPPASPKSPSFRATPMSPAVVTVPTDMHAGREAPVQFGFSEPAVAAEISAPPAAVMQTPTTPNPKRMSMASKKSTGRPETMYDEEDAYGGI